MPSYEFRCGQCLAIVTIVNAIKDKRPTPKCLACQVDMVRDYGTVAVTFKGQGFASNE